MAPRKRRSSANKTNTNPQACSSSSSYSSSSSSSSSMSTFTSNSLSNLTPAVKLTRADDLMSDVLDCCLWPSNTGSLPSKSTIKFTPGYRRPRTLNVLDIKRIIGSVQRGQLRNLTEATTLIRQLPAVMSYMLNAEPPRLGKHIGLYLQLFQSKCGVKFCETDRYDHSRRPSSSDISSLRPSSSSGLSNPPSSLDTETSLSECYSSSSPQKTRKQPRSSIPSRELRDLFGPSDRSRSSSVSVSNQRLDSHPLLKTRIHLAVFATRDYAINDIVVGCEGSFADLTEDEDLKLRANTSHPAIHPKINPSHPHDNQNDFSHLVNSRGKFQVFCGPARFVNHDCNNNVVLLREGFTIKFKVVKPIKANEEILTSYGANYFGEANCECMCGTCERLGKGFYSRIHSEDSIKSEQDEPPIMTGVAAGTDTDLNSLLDSSEVMMDSSTLDNTPLVSHAATPPHNRRSLCVQQEIVNNPTVSRSSSLRLQQARRTQPEPICTISSDVSPVTFLATTDLTAPISMDIKDPARPVSVPKEIIEEPITTPANQHLPVKRKTYWITTKQKELGVIPWDPNPVNVASSPQPYLPITPSLLGPSRRQISTSSDQANESNGNRRKPTEPEPNRKIPFKSYWISTKEKEMGIIPWEKTKEGNETEESKDNEILEERRNAKRIRCTRASIKASEGIKPFTGMPTAPKGRRLSYRVIERGTQEAELLESAIGRELLGLRPKLKRNKKRKTQDDKEEEEEEEGKIEEKDNKKMEEEEEIKIKEIKMLENDQVEDRIKGEEGATAEEEEEIDMLEEDYSSDEEEIGEESWSGLDWKNKKMIDDRRSSSNNNSTLLVTSLA